MQGNINSIRKVEILWSRKCWRKCNYCSMPNGTNTNVKSFLNDGINLLKSVKPGLVVIYGASLYMSLKGLDEFIKRLQDSGIKTTIIVEPELEDFRKIYDLPIDDITISWDCNGRSQFTDIYKNLKKRYQTVSVITTVTKRNINYVLDGWLRYPDCWFSFDFYHYPRGQTGSKVAMIPSLQLDNKDEIKKFISQVVDAKKKQRLKIQNSLKFLEFVYNNPLVVINLSWKCWESNDLSWFTIDADGTILGCDDYYVHRNFKINQKWPTFGDIQSLRHGCPGCIWSTHWDAINFTEPDNYYHV